MCGSDPSLSKEGNDAKCWAIPAMVFAILSCIGFLANAWIQGIGGILALIGASMVVCCDAAKSDGKLMGALVLYILGGAIEIIGAVIAVILFFSWKKDIEDGCAAGGSNTGASYNSCVDLLVGIVGIFVWPSVGLGVISGILILIAACKTKAAKDALSKGGAGGMA